MTAAFLYNNVPQPEPTESERQVSNCKAAIRDAIWRELGKEFGRGREPFDISSPLMHKLADVTFAEFLDRADRIY